MYLGATVEFEMDTSETKEINENVRILLVTIAVALLNLGLFIVITYIAAVIAGMVAGYLIIRGTRMSSSYSVPALDVET